MTTVCRVRTARRRGEIWRVARHRYALPEAGVLRRAAELSGVVSHTSAALHWGWKVKTVPERPSVTVRRGRRIPPDTQATVEMHWSNLGTDEICGHVTSKLRTVVDCARALPFTRRLQSQTPRCGPATSGGASCYAVRACKGRSAGKARRVAAHADRGAANPFESVLRAIPLDCGLDVLPQPPIDVGEVTLHPDVVDRERRLVLEADSWTWHAKKSDHDRDCWRYNALVVHGWTVLRFTWDQVMHSPTYVAVTIDQAVHGPSPGRGRLVA